MCIISLKFNPSLYNLFIWPAHLLHVGCKILLKTQTKIKAHTLHQVWESQVTYVGCVLTHVDGCTQH